MPMADRSCSYMNITEICNEEIIIMHNVRYSIVYSFVTWQVSEAIHSGIRIRNEAREPEQATVWFGQRESNNIPEHYLLTRINVEGFYKQSPQYFDGKESQM